MPYGNPMPYVSSGGSGAGGGMGSLIVGPAIGAGASIVGGLMGKHSASQAQRAQERANREALALQREQLDRQRQVDQYGMDQAHANAARNMQLGNALLRSYGATGLTDPTVDFNVINTPPPNIAGIPARPPMTLGQIAGAPPRPVMPTPAPGPTTLGQLFGGSPAVRRY